MKENPYEYLSDRDLNRSLFFSQLFLLILAIILSMVFFSDFTFIRNMLRWDAYAFFIYGGGVGVFIVGIQIVLEKWLPKAWMQDDGLNERLFRNQSIARIFGWVLLISVVEEFLFRGVVQTKFGLWIAVFIFTLVHIRYLKKIVLLLILIGVSLMFGLIFQMTGSLWNTILAHFIVDFLLILYMKKEEKARRGEHV